MCVALCRALSKIDAHSVLVKRLLAQEIISAPLESQLASDWAVWQASTNAQLPPLIRDLVESYQKASFTSVATTVSLAMSASTLTPSSVTGTTFVVGDVCGPCAAGGSGGGGCGCVSAVAHGDATVVYRPLSARGHRVLTSTTTREDESAQDDPNVILCNMGHIVVWSAKILLASTNVGVHEEAHNVRNQGMFDDAAEDVSESRLTSAEASAMSSNMH